MTILVKDRNGVVRFKPNRIVCDLLDWCRDHRGLDLNEIAVRTGTRYTQAERQEFYQLIGYSVDGYQDIFDDHLDDFEIKR